MARKASSVNPDPTPTARCENLVLMVAAFVKRPRRSFCFYLRYCLSVADDQGACGERSPELFRPNGVGDLPSMISLPPSIIRPVADVVLGRVVIPPVYLPEPGTVKLH